MSVGEGRVAASAVAELCRDAVDELEIVAGLEAAGYGDEEAREQGYADVFGLSGALFRQTERRPADQVAEPAPWPGGEPWRQVLRGLLFGLPGGCYVAAAPMLHRPAAAYVLIASLLQAWPAGQLVAYLGYRRTDPAERAAVLRPAALVAAGGTALVTVAAGLALHSGIGPTALAAGQCLYLPAATVALVCGAEPWLLAALLPGFAGTVVAGWWTWPCWGGSLAAVLVPAAVATRRARGRGVSWAELGAGAPFALFGLAAAALLTLEPLLGRAAVSGSGSGAAGGVAVLALSLSMGPAEWVLVSYRDRMRRAVWRARGLRAFRWRAWLGLLDAVARHGFVLAALMAGVAWAVLLAGHPVFAAYPVLIGHLLLGVALFTGLVLQSFGRTIAGPAGLGLAFVAEAVAVGLRLGDPAVVRCWTAGALLAGLLAYGLVVLSRATAHR